MCIIVEKPESSTLLEKLLPQGSLTACVYIC